KPSSLDHNAHARYFLNCAHFLDQVQLSAHPKIKYLGDEQAHHKSQFSASSHANNFQSTHPLDLLNQKYPVTILLPFETLQCRVETQTPQIPNSPVLLILDIN